MYFFGRGLNLKIIPSTPEMKPMQSNNLKVWTFLGSTIKKLWELLLISEEEQDLEKKKEKVHILEKYVIFLKIN